MNQSVRKDLSGITLVLTTNRKGEERKWQTQESTYTLDAGTGFDSYKWSTGETSQTVTKGIGEYYVDLETNGCIYRQNVKIIAASEPTIDSVIEQGNSITVNVSGGTAPYE